MSILSHVSILMDFFKSPFFKHIVSNTKINDIDDLIKKNNNTFSGLLSKLVYDETNVFSNKLNSLIDNSQNFLEHLNNEIRSNQVKYLNHNGKLNITNLKKVIKDAITRSASTNPNKITAVDLVDRWFSPKAVTGYKDHQNLINIGIPTVGGGFALHHAITTPTDLDLDPAIVNTTPPDINPAIVNTNPPDINPAIVNTTPPDINHIKAPASNKYLRNAITAASGSLGAYSMYKYLKNKRNHVI